MTMTEIEFKGTDGLLRALKANAQALPKIKHAVAKNGARLSQYTQQYMNERYRGHYEGKKFIRPTGTTRRSAIVHIDQGGLRAFVAPDTSYFPYLEFGTIKMAARPTLRPAFNKVEPLFKEDIKKAIKGG